MAQAKRREPRGQAEGDVHALDRDDDPRGGVQSKEYRGADPRDVSEEDGTVMATPAEHRRKGCHEERRREDRS